MDVYPLHFRPILKPKIWGGQKLKEFLYKSTPEGSVGESWEISAVPPDVSMVDNGSLKGWTLTALTETFGKEFVGERIYTQHATNFPLLFKFIDAKENLSLQVHPNNVLARKRHNALGKNELWYVLQVDPGAGIYVGFTPGVAKKEYLDRLEGGDLQSIMNFIPVKPGDAFLIEAGLVHAIGEGVLLAEIQQSSDITYRVFDWNRIDANGRSRQLHTDLAMDAIDFSLQGNALPYDKNLKNRLQNLMESSFFRCNFGRFTNNYRMDFSKLDSFVVLMCVGGEAEVTVEGKSESLKLGSTLLLPAVAKEAFVKTQNVDLIQITA